MCIKTKFEPINKCMIEQFEEFILSDKNFGVIDEPAGTGKTEFIKDCINNYCVPNNVSFDVIAYTGKAASVLRSRISGKGSTIHKFLYEVDYVFDEETEQFKRKNKIKKIKLDILFIDESSMLSTGVTGFKVDGEKTFLLDELIKKLKNDEIKKIIFVGDSMQLPPIEDKVDIEDELDDVETDQTINKFFPDALNPDFMRVHYGLDFYYFNRGFKENFRHIPSNSIFQLSQQLRADLITDKARQKSSPAKWIVNKSKDFVFNEDQVLEWYESKGVESNFVNTRIFTYTNNKAEDWNRKVRNHLGFVADGEIEPIGVNEPLINLVNKSYKGVFNGDTFVVNKIYETHELTSTYSCQHEFCSKVKNRRSEFSLHRADISIFTEDSKVQKKDIYLTSRSIPPNDSNIKRVFNTHLWCDFANRNEELEHRRFNSEEDYKRWDNARDIDSIYSAVIPSYAYATTTHKTQADSFDYGVIDISDEMKDLKWLYTTLTRIKKDFIIFSKD